jgi:hypothetical protein
MPKPSVNLSTLSVKINAGIKRGAEHFREVGKWLRQAQALCAHGTFLDWLKKNVSCSKSQAYRYMALAKIPETGNLIDEWRRISNSKPADPTMESGLQNDSGHDPDELATADDPPKEVVALKVSKGDEEREFRELVGYLMEKVFHKANVKDTVFAALRFAKERRDAIAA